MSYTLRLEVSWNPEALTRNLRRRVGEKKLALIRDEMGKLAGYVANGERPSMEEPWMRMRVESQGWRLTQ